MKYLYQKRNNTAADPETVQRLAKEFGISSLLAELLMVRGIMEDTGAFPNPDIRNMHDPHLFRDMKKAVELIRAASLAHKKICIFGDYDADGVSAAAILYRTLKKMNSETYAYLPIRQEGYGLNMEAVRKIAEEGASLLITADCGVSNVQEIKTAKDLGMQVIITDHHECPSVLPDADAILNAKREGETYPFRELCGGGVAFKLACALTGKEAFELIDLAAVATIADIVPLLSENRILAAKGLYKLNKSPSAGLEVLIRESGFAKRQIESESVAFGIIPRINAAGRLGDPKTAFTLLCGEVNRTELESLARQLCSLNAKRQGMQEEIVDKSVRMAQEYGEHRILVLQDDNWDTGVVGLAASALTERFGKPAILFGLRDGFYVGSARSVLGVNIYNAIRESESLLEVFGGHEAAAGMTIKKENLPVFRERMNTYMFAHYSEEDFRPRAFYDMEGKLAEINGEVIRELYRLKPFGCRNEPVRILLRDVHVTEKHAIGNGNHSRLRLYQEGSSINGVAFGIVSADIPDHMDALVSVQINDYNGDAEAIVDLMSF